MSLLINREIQESLGDAIIIQPFKPEQLNTNSYDLCLGPWIARYVHKTHPLRIADDVTEFQLQNVLQPEKHRDGTWARHGVPDALLGYIKLVPGERVLAHSVEFAGGRVAGRASWPHAVTTSLRATSTAGRLGLTVCACAGLGDVGYIDRWTFELQNHGPNTVMIPVGAVVAQLEFYAVEPPPADTLYGKAGRGQYQLGENLEELVMAWRPEKMLPKRLKRKDWALDAMQREFGMTVEGGAEEDEVPAGIGGGSSVLEQVGTEPDPAEADTAPIRHR